MTKKAIQEFEPSTGEETYLSAKDIPPEWSKIKMAWIDSRRHASIAVELFLEMGDMLIELRKTFKGDNEFGKARKKYVPELSRNDAWRAMQMAKNRERFTLPEGQPNPSISVFAEMVTASDDLVEAVVAETADPDTKTPTVKEVRERVKAESAEDFEAEVSERDEPLPDVEQDEEPEPVLADWFNMTVLARIRKFRKAKRHVDHEVAHLVVGLNPYYDGNMPMSVEVWSLVRHEASKYLDPDQEPKFNGKEQDYLQDCIDTIQGDCYDA
jgi:hypothetical protein